MRLALHLYLLLHTDPSKIQSVITIDHEKSSINMIKTVLVEKMERPVLTSITNYVPVK